MATRKWRGDAPKVAQISTVQVTAYDSSTTYIITMNGKTVSVVGITDAPTTATALKTALAASIIPEFAEVIWTVNSSTVTGTAKTAGVPFTFTKSVSGGSGTMGSVTTTAGSGPNDVSIAANWTGAALPTTSDDVVFENNAIDAC